MYRCARTVAFVILQGKLNSKLRPTSGQSNHRRWFSARKRTLFPGALTNLTGTFLRNKITGACIPALIHLPSVNMDCDRLCRHDATMPSKEKDPFYPRCSPVASNARRQVYSARGTSLNAFVVRLVFSSIFTAESLCPLYVLLSADTFSFYFSNHLVGQR